jgi:hypothetical protein
VFQTTAQSCFRYCFAKHSIRARKFLLRVEKSFLFAITVMLFSFEYPMGLLSENVKYGFQNGGGDVKLH